MLVFAVAFAGSAAERTLNRPLDPGHPVVVTRPYLFTYDGQDYQLDSRHFLVDATLDSAAVASSPWLFSSIREALSHLADGTEADPMTVYVAPNVYWVDDPDDPTVRTGVGGREPFGMTVRCAYLHIIGLTHDARHVVLASRRGQTQGAVGNFTMFDFYGDGLEVSHLTMGNYCNVDLEYPLMPSLGRQRRSSAITQAHLAYCHGDRVVARDVRFVSRLNMNPLNGARRILFDHCHMECTDDALTGNGVYLHCDFDFYGQKPFYTTAQTGAVMLDCDFYLKGESRQAYFSKASGPLTLIDCRFHSTADVYVGWTAYPAPWLRCYYSNVTMNGQPYVVESEHPETSVCLDHLPLLKVFKDEHGYNIGGLLGGKDGWNPVGRPETVSRPTSLVIMPRQLALRGGERPTLLGVQLRCHDGSLPSHIDRYPLTWKVQEGYEHILRLTPETGGCGVGSDYDDDAPLDILVTATTPDGLESAIQVHLEGKPLPPPAFSRPPRIRLKDGVATLDYVLRPGNHGDESDIRWMVGDESDTARAVVVAESHGQPLRTFEVGQGTAGHFLMAVVTPRHARSAPGMAAVACTRRPVTLRQTKVSRVVETDFHDFPCRWQPLLKEGCWTVDGFKPADTEAFPWTFDRERPMWEYGEGYNGAVGYGLLQAQRGARIMYTPVAGDHGGMSVALDVDPTKTAGQGFGSATGQYMDVCLNFDTHTLTGYGLRIIRTTKYAKAVDFLLVAYDHGTVTPLTAPVSAVCYRTGCHIRLDCHEGLLTAHVDTDTPLTQPDDPNLHTEVSLKAQVPPLAYGGFCLQHTGSCGESTTMLHRLRLEWDH